MAAATSTAEAVDDPESQLMAHLECPVCLETFTPPIYMCSNGHSVCSKCQVKLIECGICRAPGRPAVRCYSLEKIVGLVKVPCKNVKYGCKKKLAIPAMKEQASCCLFNGSAYCWMCPEWRAATSKALVPHLTKTHKAVRYKYKPFGIYVISTNIFTLGSTNTTLHAIIGSKFWLQMSFDRESKSLSCTMRFIGGGIFLTGSYCFSIELKGKVGVHSVRYTREVSALNEEVVEGQNGKFVGPKGIVDRRYYSAVDFTLTIKSNVTLKK